MKVGKRTLGLPVTTTGEQNLGAMLELDMRHVKGGPQGSHAGAAAPPGSAVEVADEEVVVVVFFSFLFFCF